MTRTRRALVMAGFNYAQFGLAMVSGFFLIPLILGRLGPRTYGLWLASGEGLVYAAMVDLGVFGVLPWMIASADGRRDEAALRRLVVNGLAVGIAAAIGYLAVIALLWSLLPAILGVTPADRMLIAGPLLFLVALTAVTYPLRVFTGLLAGLQDVVFNGIVAVLQLALTIVITVVLLLQGWQLYALAAAAAVPPAVAAVLAVLRVRRIAPYAMRGWSRPTIAESLHLLGEGSGVWMSSLGVQLLAASNALVITYLGHPEWVPIYVCTAKLSQVLLQMAWVLPDSGFVGLAQLHGEGNVSRTRDVVGGMLRLHLILSGATAVAVLTLNQTFVTVWVGPALFGGFRLTVVLGLGAIVLSLIHGLISATAVLGNRPLVGLGTLANGAVHVALAIMLGTRFGLVGIALAAPISGALTTLPLALRLLRPATGLLVWSFLCELLWPWVLRATPVLSLGLVVAAADSRWTVGAAVGTAVIYVWCMRPLYRMLPISPQLRAWLVRFRLEPRRAAPVTR